MAGLGRLEADLGGLAVAQLSDHDDVGVLAQGRAQRGLKALGVPAHLALDEHRLAVAEDEFDRVLDGDDVQPIGAVHELQHGRDGAGLAVAGGAGDEHQPLPRARDGLHHHRQVQLLEVPHLEGNHPHHQSQAAALVQDVDAKAGEPGEREASVQLLGEIGGHAPLPFGIEDHAHDGAGVVGRQSIETGREQIPVNTVDRGIASFEVNIARALADAQRQQVVESFSVHGASSVFVRRSGNLG